MMNDLLSKLYLLSPLSRRARVKQYLNKDHTKQLIMPESALNDGIGDTLIENFLTYFRMPVGIVPDITIDDQSFNFTLAVEETSIIAALNATVKTFRDNGRIYSSQGNDYIKGQISYQSSLLNELCLLDHKDQLKKMLMQTYPSYFKRENPIINITKKCTQDFSIYYLEINSGDSMGANLVTQFCESTSRYLTQVENFPKPLMNIVSNSLIKPNIKVCCELEIDQELGRAIELASKFAHQDPMRASTHNKGILNAIDPIVMASGNDWRAINANLHSWAARGSQYSPLSNWEYRDSVLYGEMEIPLQLGIIGGATKIHPDVKFCLNLMGINSKSDLKKVITTAGLLQNFAALKALVSDGIVRGHMKLHLKNIVKAADMKDRSNEEKLMCELEGFLSKNRKVTNSDAQTIISQLNL